jgi:hypothetical protein
VLLLAALPHSPLCCHTNFSPGRALTAECGRGDGAATAACVVPAALLPAVQTPGGAHGRCRLPRWRAGMASAAGGGHSAAAATEAGGRPRALALARVGGRPPSRRVARRRLLLRRPQIASMQRPRQRSRRLPSSMVSPPLQDAHEPPVPYAAAAQRPRQDRRALRAALRWRRVARLASRGKRLVERTWTRRRRRRARGMARGTEAGMWPLGRRPPDAPLCSSAETRAVPPSRCGAPPRASLVSGGTSAAG